MTIATAARISRAPLAGLVAVGVFWGGFAAYIPDFKARIGASDSALGLALVGSSIGGIIAMYLAPMIHKALRRATLPAAGILLTIALAYPLLAHSVPAFAVALVGVGISVTLLDICSNIRISDLEAEHRLHLMNLNHAGFSFAFAASAFGASVARRAGLAPEWYFPIMAVGIAALTLATVERQSWSAPPEAPAGAGHDGVWSAILPVAAILFLSFVSENSTDSWSALHIERTLDGPPGYGGLGPMMLGLTMGLGRLSGQFASTRLGEAGLIFWSSVVGVVGAVVVASAPTPLIAVAGVGLLGLGLAVTVPSASSILGKLVRPDQRGYAISRAWMFGFTGFFIGPTLMGQIAQHFGLRVAFFAIALLLAMVLPLISMLRRRAG